MADTDGERPHPDSVPAPPKPESSCPPPDRSSSAPSPPPDTGAAPKFLAVPSPSAQPAAGSTPDCRSFSQLLAGAMASPAGSPRAAAPILAMPVPVVSVPCFLTPAGALLESPGFTFAMTHQAVLATVTAQAQMQIQAVHPSSSDILTTSFPQPILSTISPVPLQQRAPHVPEDNVGAPVVEQVHSSDQKPQAAQIVANTNSGGDGYNWRKYGQKQVKSSENSRSYYKCTNGNCFAKKKVERCPDGRVTNVMYRGQHNHGPPQQTRCSRERGVRSGAPLGESEIFDLPSSEINELDPSTSKTNQNYGNENPEQQLFCSSDCEGDAGIKAEDDLGDEPNPKRRLSESTMTCSAPLLKTFREPKIVVQSASDVGRASDGYKWRKYGQKFVKGNPNPRSYYRCTHNGCPVRKHVERASDDAKAIVMTYEGEHNHDLPAPKNSSDPPASPIHVAAAATVAPDERLHTSDSLLDKKPPTKLLPDLDGESTSDKASELGGEKALESAEALLSIGFNSSAGEDGGRTDPEGAKPALCSENHAAVPLTTLDSTGLTRI